MKNSIIVLVEHFMGNISDISFEMLGAGRKLAESFNVPLLALIIGKDIKKYLSSLGIADTIIIAEDTKLEMPAPSVSAGIINKIFNEKDASVLLIGGTNITSGIGPVLAAKLNIPFINFCNNLKIENDSVIVTSQLFGGKILTDINVNDNKCIISVYPGSFLIEEGKANKTATVEEAEIPQDIKTNFRKFIEPEPGDVDITKEDILISIGRGIDNNDNIGMAEELADVLEGAISASRPVIDQGWLPLSRQVGKSGMIVKPKLYFAVGISGAPEHVEGMKDSGLIVAINKDPAAPIFNVAHFGICNDLNDVLPVLTEKLKKRKQ